MNFEKIINCKGQKGRPESGICKLCGTNHSMSFEFYKEKIKNTLSNIGRRDLTDAAFESSQHSNLEDFERGYRMALQRVSEELE